MTLEELRARQEAIASERRALHEAAGNESLSDEQQSRWDTLDTEETEIRTQVEAAERRERVEQSRQRFGVSLLEKVDPFDGTDVRTLGPSQARDKALAVLDSRDHTSHLEDRQREHLEGLLRQRTRNTDGAAVARRMLLTENEHYRSAFQKLVTRTQPVLLPEEARAVDAAVTELREMNIGTDADGGYGVPVLIDPTIVLTAQGHPNDFFQLARVETITTNEWKGVSSAGVSWQFRGEGASASDNSPTLAQPGVTAHRADGYIPYTFEVNQDYPGFASEMMMLLGSGYSELLVDKFTLGDGSDEPFGIVTALAGTASEIDVAVTGTIDADDINGVWAALPIRYRRSGGQWMSNTTINNVIQQLGSGNNDAAFTVNFTAEGVPVLKGRQTHLNDYMASLNGAAEGLLVTGDWSNYLIAQRAGMSIELVPHVFDTSGAVSVPNGQRAWFAWARVGANVINTNGFRMLSDDGT